MSAKNKPKTDPDTPEEIHRAARFLGCRAEDLLSWRRYENGAVVVIAPDGKKWRFEPRRNGGENEPYPGLFA